MKDRYPVELSVPAGKLVSIDAQPEYNDLPGADLPETTNIGWFLSNRHVAEGRGDVTAAINAQSGKSYTFAELARESDRLARALIRLGVRMGDRIAYRSPNVPEVLIVMFGAWKAGAIVTPVPTYTHGQELRHLLADSLPRFLFLHESETQPDAVAAVGRELAVERVFSFGAESRPTAFESWNALLETAPDSDPLPAIPGDAVAVLWHTGGTTGRPKGCYHTHRRFLLGGMALARATGASVGERWSATTPIGHALGFIHHTIYSILNGATAVFIEQFSKPEIVLKAVTDWKITTLTGLSPTWSRMLDVLASGASYDLSSLKRCYAMWQSASSSEVYDRWREHGVELLNNFGSTAFATWVLVPRLGESSPRASLGKPAPGYEVEAVAVEDGKVAPLPRGTIGRMAVRGPTGLTYWGLPDMQSRDIVDGWTLCDDLIRFDETGNAHYYGRTDYMISTSGHKVAPVEVEQVLSAHPAVREVAVVPAPCPVRHEIVAAYIALQDGVAPSDALRSELQTLAKTGLAPYKAPREIRFVTALPRDAVGKVQTRVVREWASGTAPIPPSIVVSE